MIPFFLSGALALSTPSACNPPAVSAQAENAELEAQAKQQLDKARIMETPTALPHLDELVRRYGAATSTGLRHVVDEALYLKTFNFFENRRYEEGTQAYGELQARRSQYQKPAQGPDRFADWDEVLISRLASDANLHRQQQPEAKANPPFEVLLGLFGSTRNPDLAGAVAVAMLEQSASLKAAGRAMEDLQILDLLVSSFGTMGDCSVCHLVNSALDHKGEMLRDLSRIAEGERAFAEIFRRNAAQLGDGRDDATLRVLRIQGKDLLDQSRYDEALQRHDEALRLLDLRLMD